MFKLGAVILNSKKREMAAMTNTQEIKDTYMSTLQDLICNSKPLISVLTMLAEENVAHAKAIAETIEEHLAKVRTEVKLPVLYLIDCIVKNVGGPYTAAFSTNIANLFCSVFQAVDEKTRMELFKLRQTWTDVFSKSKLYALDMKTSRLDPAWPVTAAPPNIHVNPRFLHTKNAVAPDANNRVAATAAAISEASVPESTLDMQQKLLLKQKQLLELQQKKLELELLQTQVKLQEQMKKNTPGNPPSSLSAAEEAAAAAAKITLNSKLLLKPEVAKQLLSDKKDESAKAMIARINQTLPLTGKANAAPTRAASRDPRLLRQHQQQQRQAVLQIPLPPGPIVEDAASAGDAAAADAGGISLVLDNKAVNTSNHKFGRDVDNKSNQSAPKSHKTLSRIPLKSSTMAAAATAAAVPAGTPATVGKSKTLTSLAARHRDALKTLVATAAGGSSSTGSTSSLDSPKKLGGRRSTSKSPTAKYKNSGKGGGGGGKRMNDKRSGGKRDRSPVKKKNNRRNRRRSKSPAGGDRHEDLGLRNNGPPEKQARMSVEKDGETRVSGKKRISSDRGISPHNKKNRAEIFDVLFGSEDVDQRKIADGERPITPPAPIISTKKDNTEKENSNGSHESADATPKLSLDVLRQKLANATNANLQKSRQQEQKRLENNKIFITSAEEETIKSGKMTKAQETSLMGKIIAQIENHKLKEAKRKENEEGLGSMMTQPISDDEFDSDIEERPQPAGFNAIVDNNTPRFEPPAHPREQPWQMRPNNNPPFVPIHPAQQAGLRSRADPWLRPTLMGGPIFRPHFIPPVVEPLCPPGVTMDLTGSPPPPSGPDDICMMSQQNVKSISIDGQPREIVFYGETAIALMTPEDPREISFQSGQRRVIFDDMHSYVLHFNEPYREIMIGGYVHRVRLGTPTREIYVDGKHYECVFGGPPIGVELDRKLVAVQIDGPPPQVKIGVESRTDLVAGKVNLIIDAKSVTSIYLDARVQTFEVNGVISTLRFKDALRTVLINEQQHVLEFGGLPKGVMINGRKHFIRFSVLPKGVRPGHVFIRDMEGFRPSKGDRGDSDGNSQDGSDSNAPVDVVQPRARKTRFSEPSPERVVPNSVNMLQQPNFGNLDMLLSIASSAAAMPPTNTSSYQIEAATPAIVEQPPIIPVTNAPLPVPVPAPTVAPTIPPVLNINDLFQKLVATGIVTTLNQNAAPPESQKNVKQPSPKVEDRAESIPPKQSNHHVKHEVPMKPVSFDEPVTLKLRQPLLVHAFYSGMQCSSCGMRFSQDNSGLYSQHLDWHFRQNRKGKKNVRKASSRKWYYTIADWSNYEEIEDLDDREKCYFENQQKDQTEGQTEENDVEMDAPSVPADPNDPDPRCAVCQEKFEQFYNEEKEEWHLRSATRVEDHTYHPLCYEDLQALNEEAANTAQETTPSIDAEMKDECIIPGLDVPPDEPSTPVTIDTASSSAPNTPKGEEVDEHSQDVVMSEENKTEPTADDEKKEATDANGGEAMHTDDDDDVIINEVVPEHIVLDDYEFDENGLIAGVVVKQEPVDDGFTDIENFRLGTGSPVVKDELAAQDESFVDIGIIESEPPVPTTATSAEPTTTDDTTASAANPTTTPSPPPASSDANDALAQIAPTSPSPPAENGNGDGDNNDTLETTTTTTACRSATQSPQNVVAVEAVVAKEAQPPPPILTCVPTIDGNLDCANTGATAAAAAPPATQPPPVSLPPGVVGPVPGARIKINISKPLPVIAPKENKDISADVDHNIEPVDPHQPLPSTAGGVGGGGSGGGEQQLVRKPALRGVELKAQSPVKKGSELTGLCSIM